MHWQIRYVTLKKDRTECGILGFSGVFQVKGGQSNMKNQSSRADDCRGTDYSRLCGSGVPAGICGNQKQGGCGRHLQEVFLRYVRKPPLFQSREHEKAWLIRVTINCCKSFGNRRLAATSRCRRRNSLHRNPSGRDWRSFAAPAGGLSDGHPPFLL